MIRAPNVYSLIKAPYLQLVAVIGNIGGEIGRVAVGAYEHLVLELKALYLLLALALLTELGGEDFFIFIPKGAVLLIG